MRQQNAALQAVLASGGPFVLADLFTFTFTNGTVKRWTTSQQELTIGADTFAVGPLIERDKARWKTGLNVDQMEVTITDDGSQTISGQPLVVAVWANLFDYAQVEIDRFISDSWDNTDPGKTNIFTGKVGDADVDKKTITLSVESQVAEMQATFPRTYIMPSCANTLYDGVCSLLAANFTSSGTVGANPTASQFTLSGVSQPDGYYALGKVIFTSGPNAGQTRQIKSYQGGVITLAYPLYTIPDAGNTVDVVAGCDKTRATCTNRFNNLANFRGFPYVPDPATQMGDAGSSGGQGSSALNSGGGSRARGPGGNLRHL